MSCGQVLEEIDGAIVGDFGFPAVLWEWVKENITTADVSMDDGVWLHQVEVVEGSSHIQADGGNVGFTQRSTMH